MSVICSVCQDAITADPNEGSVRDPTKRVGTSALRCGHLFHENCINQWFTSKGNPQSGPCPACNVLAHLTQAIRVYLSLEEDSSSSSSGSSISRKQLEKKVTDLEKQLKQKTEELKRKENENKRIIMNSAHESMELMYVFDDLKSIFGLESHRGGMSDVVELIKNKYNAAKK